MALEISHNSYEKVYDPSGPEKKGKYYEGYVEKKEKFNKWTKYWCVLKEQNIHFFKDVNTQIKENYAGFFRLEQPTNVEIIKSKDWKYDWTIKTTKKKIMLRTTVPSERENWIMSMEKSLKCDPPSTESHILPGSGPVSPKRSVPSSASLSPSRTPSQLPHRTPSQRMYMVTHEQMSALNEYSEEIESMVKLTDEEIKIQDELLYGDKRWYQPSCCREDAEKILSNENNGVFIVRGYIDVRTGRNMGYKISLKDQVGQIRHHRIENIEDKFIIKGYEGRHFDSLHDLLRFFILSQRKKITLVPFNPRKLQSQPAQPAPDSGYERMEPPQDCITERKPRSRSFQERGMPPVPPDPVSSMARAVSMKDRPLPTPPPPLNNTPLKSRPLPPFPPEDEGYLVCSQSADRSYVNYPEPPASPNTQSYENVDNTIEPDEEPPPVLPPRKRASSVKQYVNYPRSDLPGPNPLRKANTLF